MQLIDYNFLLMGRMTEEDHSLIFNLRVHKGWGSWRMMKEFPLKMWNRRTVDNSIKRIDSEGTLQGSREADVQNLLEARKTSRR